MLRSVGPGKCEKGGGVIIEIFILYSSNTMFNRIMSLFNLLLLSTHG